MEVNWLRQSGVNGRGSSYGDRCPLRRAAVQSGGKETYCR
jgi:hypothetical protein